MDTIRYLGSLMCHQEADRCLVIGQMVAPLCIRCISMGIGTISALIGYLLIGKRHLGVYFPIFLLIAGGCPLAIDGFTQALGYRESTNLLRLCTGLSFGIFVTMSSISMLIYLFSWTDCCKQWEVPIILSLILTLSLLSLSFVDDKVYWFLLSIVGIIGLSIVHVLVFVLFVSYSVYVLYSVCKGG